jgi:type II secretory pathway component GspD/PulD (secretin)
MRVFKTLIIAALTVPAMALMPGHIAAQQASDPPPAPAASSIEAAPPPPLPGGPVEVVAGNGEMKLRLNFQDAPLQTVLEYLSENAGLTVVSDEPLIDGRMTVISRQPIPLSDAISLINSMLKERGLTSILNGKVLKVVTLDSAKQESVPVFSGRDPEAIVPGDDIVTYVIPVSYVRAEALRENLEGLIPEYASLEANEDGNALIVTDTLANIHRLMKIVAALDTHMASVAEIRVFRLVNADATSAANMINTMFEQNQPGGRSSRGGRGGGPSPFEIMMNRMRGGGPPGFGGRGPGGFGGRGR